MLLGFVLARALGNLKEMSRECLTEERITDIPPYVFATRSRKLVKHLEAHVVDGVSSDGVIIHERRGVHAGFTEEVSDPIGFPILIPRCPWKRPRSSQTICSTRKRSGVLCALNGRV